MAPPSPSRSASPLPPDPIDGLEPMDNTPLSPPFVSLELDPQQCRMDFPAASKTYGRGKTFADSFNDNKFAPYRVQNTYYLFADQEEWELGSFLLRSGMLMQKVDEFLRLKLVSEFSLPRYIVNQLLSRSRVPGLHSILQRTYEVELKSCQVSQSGSSRKSPLLDMLPRS